MSVVLLTVASSAWFTPSMVSMSPSRVKEGETEETGRARGGVSFVSNGYVASDDRWCLDISHAVFANGCCVGVVTNDEVS